MKTGWPLFLLVAWIGSAGAAPPGSLSKLSTELQAWSAGRELVPGQELVLRAQLRRGVGATDLLRSLTRARSVRDAAGREVIWLRVPSELMLETALRLADDASVAWVERYGPMRPDNDASSWLLQSGDEALGRTIWARGLTGRGQVIGVADTGLDMDACQFRRSANPDARTQAVAVPQPPDALVDRPDNKVITYYLLGDAEAYDSAGSHYHGTHSAGNAAGDNYLHLAGPDGNDFYDLHDGMAPGAQIVFQDIGSHDGYLVGLYAGSMYDILSQAYRTGARIHTNSYGRSGPSPGYDIDSASIDEAIWAHNDLLVLFSAGNYGPEAQTVNGTGAVAKNTLTVGASGPVSLDVFGSILSLAEELLFFSSQGPTADGRLKPELIAPGMTFSATTDPDTREYLGCCDRDGQDMYASASNDDNCNVDTDWPAIGTSFSTPVTAGAAALVRQYYVFGYWYAGRSAPEWGFSPSAALLKATLIHGAVPLAGEVFMSDQELAPRPASGQGFGRVNLEHALWFEGDEHHSLVLADVFNPLPDGPQAAPDPPAFEDENLALSTGDERRWTLPPLAAGAQLKACLVWSDPPAEPGADPALVNDLDLALSGPDGSRWLGNRGFGADGLAQPVGQVAPDGSNNVECIFCELSTAGLYELELHARAVPGNGQAGSDRQGFALVVSAPFLPPSPLSVTPARAAPGETLSGVLVTGANFGPDTQLDLGPDITLEQLRVVDDETIEIGSLHVADGASQGERMLEARVARTLVGRAEGLFAVRVPGCGCAANAPAGTASWLLAVFCWLGWRRRTRGRDLS